MNQFGEFGGPQFATHTNDKYNDKGCLFDPQCLKKRRNVGKSYVVRDFLQCYDNFVAKNDDLQGDSE